MDEFLEENILTIAEVASYLRVSPPTLQGMANAGEVPCFRVGKRWKFSKPSIVKWIKDKEAVYSKKQKQTTKAVPRRKKGSQRELHLYNLSPNRGTWKTLKALCFFRKRGSKEGGRCAYCFADQTTIARLIHLSERQVRRSIQTLVALKIGIYERDSERRGGCRFVFSDEYRKQAIALGRTLSKIEREHIATWEPPKHQK